MFNTSLALRYARGLHKISITLGNTAKVCENLNDISHSIDANPDLKRVLYHPEITAEEKKKVMAALFAPSCENVTMKFMGFIIDKKRIFHCTAIARCFSDMLDRDENRVNVRTESVSRPSGETLKKIKASLTKSLEKNIVITSEVNPSLMGGMRIILGDRVIDGSVAFQLKRLKETITSF
ncbi:MAG TPA: ATP synthase F1 subunit delta [Chitinivibrionales bacterium]|nr:ATP synthase F1 subunit delta [Chitinivibrionales bacterium]